MIPLARATLGRFEEGVGSDKAPPFYSIPSPARDAWSIHPSSLERLN